MGMVLKSRNVGSQKTYQNNHYTYNCINTLFNINKHYSFTNLLQTGMKTNSFSKRFTFLVKDKVFWYLSSALERKIYYHEGNALVKKVLSFNKRCQVN